MQESVQTTICWMDHQKPQILILFCFYFCFIDRYFLYSQMHGNHWFALYESPSTTVSPKNVLQKRKSQPHLRWPGVSKITANVWNLYRKILWIAQKLFFYCTAAKTPPETFKGCIQNPYGKKNAYSLLGFRSTNWTTLWEWNVFISPCWRISELEKGMLKLRTISVILRLAVGANPPPFTDNSLFIMHLGRRGGGLVSA